MPPKVKANAKAKAIKGGAYDSSVMNTRGLMDSSHSIYNSTGDNGLLAVHSPFSAGMGTFSSGSSGIDTTAWKYFVPSLGAPPAIAGGGKASVKAPKAVKTTKGPKAVKPKKAAKKV